MGGKNRILLSCVRSGIAVVEDTSNTIKKERKLQRSLLLGSYIIYLLLAISASASLFCAPTRLGVPLLVVSSTMFVEAALLLCILTTVAQTIAHIINRGPLLPKSPHNRVVVVLLQMGRIQRGGRGAQAPLPP
ncbi:uncharacterized protein LOC120683999 [Panicum virgatum]|uniref:uncharacterized protein LOC120683999 n=1 Tax=Panicum virgatum TaxID=38727 RepID=UPI0019D57BE5|nr:uncharacterized protein LOC120683999 [Panicum virgatum]